MENSNNNNGGNVGDRINQNYLKYQNNNNIYHNSNSNINS